MKLGYDNAQSMLDDLQDRLDEIAGFEGVKDNYGAAVDAIQKLIDDLTAKVELIRRTIRLTQPIHG